MTQYTDQSFQYPADTWDKRFAADGYLFGVEPNEWLREHAAVWPPAVKVLCVADGEGRNSTWLAGRGLHVDAFDISAVGVSKATQLAKTQGVTVNFEVADCEAYHWPEAGYDGVAAIFIQFADPDLRARIFSRIVRSLKPGGVLILQGYTPKQLDYRTGGPPQVSHLYTKAMLRSAFSELEVEVLQEYEAELSEGTAHKGHSALIGLVARRL